MKSSGAFRERLFEAWVEIRENLGRSVLQALGVLLGVAYAVLVSISRVVVQAHSSSEAVSGCVLGLAVALGFMWQARGAAQIAVSHALVLACLALMVLITFKAEPMPTEDWLQKIALALSGHERVFSRADWQLASGGPGRP